MLKRYIGKLGGAALAGLSFAAPAMAQDDSAELAKKLSNPIAALISIPFQFNYNGGIGPDEDGFKQLNVGSVQVGESHAMSRGYVHEFW